MPVPDVLLSGHHKTSDSGREKKVWRLRCVRVRISLESRILLVSLTREDVKFLRTMGAKNISEGRRS